LHELEALQHDYRTDVLGIDIPAPQRDAFVTDFERAFAASAAQTKELNADFERVELAIAAAILGITELIEREGEAVAVGSDGKTLLFERPAAAGEYNSLLQALQKVTAEEEIVMTRSSEAFRQRADTLGAAAPGSR
jgi:hypothetical protein